MADVRNLTDRELLTGAERLVLRERELLGEVLRHLREIERRRLFSAQGFRSIFDYCVRRLKYSEDQASRRISAMRLLEELPEIQQKLDSGTLTLSTMGMAQTLFRAEEKARGKKVPKEEMRATLAELEQCSYREAKKIVLAKSSAPEHLRRPDRVESLADQKVEIRFVGEADLLEKLEIVRGLIAHRRPSLTLAELISFLSDFAIERLDPAKRRPPATSRVKRHASGAGEPRPSDRPHVREEASDRGALAARPSRHIPDAIRREVWRRAGSRCSRCWSRYALQIEHLRPFAAGGGHDLSNLALYCRACNQRSAIEKVGARKMQRHLESCP